jgi:hypothetical protein
MAKNSIPLPQIIGTFKAEVNKTLSAMLPQIKQDLDDYIRGGVIKRALYSNETVQALADDHSPLRGLLGLPRRREHLKGAELVDGIDEFLLKNLKSKIIKYGVRSAAPSVNNTIKINITEILNEKFAYYTYLRKRGRKPDGSYILKKQRINWLSWLLEYGNNIAVSDWHVANTKPLVYGRSGLRYLMRQGGEFRVPSEHAGTPKNNFITRAIDDYSDEMVKEMRGILRGSIKKASKIAAQEARKLARRRKR